MTACLEEAAATLVFLHGRGESPEASERFAARLELPGLAVVSEGSSASTCLAPELVGDQAGSWGAASRDVVVGGSQGVVRH